MEKIVLPKILIVDATPPQNIMAYVSFLCSAADFYTADIPDGWGSENCAMYQQNPPQTSPPEMIDMAKKEWPDLAAHFPALDVRVFNYQNSIGWGYACIIKAPRDSPPADTRYPQGFFPHLFKISFYPKAPSNFSQFLSDGHYRHTGFYAKDVCDVSFDSHEEVTAFLSALSALTTEVPLSLRLCPHGAYKTPYLCKKTC